jgi:phenylalanyl-tRNA synthetase alpha chain
LEEKIGQLTREFKSDLEKVQNSREAEQLKVKYLGKKGPIAALMMELRGCSTDQRPLFGKLINDFKISAEGLCDQAITTYSHTELSQAIDRERIDISLPGRRRFSGHTHPITQMLDRIVDVLSNMGFSVEYGPDIDSDYYNFGGLNYPDDHPARDMQDTFYVNDEFLLRSHTSNVQLRVMESQKPPLRVIAPGRVYRNETISARSHVFFHQVEGIYIDKDVSFTDLLSTLQLFWSKLFESDIETRFRPSFFPFVEPGIEVDIRCISCKGNGCPICKRTGWLEVGGAGMVHPEVLKNGGIDPEEYSGYAWGLGVDRLAMLLYGIDDIRMFTENDVRFLNQF